MIPSLRVVLTAPQWLVVTMLAAVIAAALFRIGLDLYVTHGTDRYARRRTA